MFPPRYTLIDERSPGGGVKRRMRGDRVSGKSEPAITLLPPDPYLIIDKPFSTRDSDSPRVYRTVPPKSAKNSEASSFVILGETLHSPVQSRPGTPSGRISPFRGHGFKSPATTRPNSRANSPAASPKRAKQNAERIPERGSFGSRGGYNVGYIGLRSPVRTRMPPEHVNNAIESNANFSSHTGGSVMSPAKMTSGSPFRQNNSTTSVMETFEGMRGYPERNEESYGHQKVEDPIDRVAATLEEMRQRFEGQSRVGVTAFEPPLEELSEMGHYAGIDGVEQKLSTPSRPNTNPKKSESVEEDQKPETPMEPMEKLMSVEYIRQNTREDLRKPPPNRSKTKPDIKSVQPKDRMIRKSGKPPLPSAKRPTPASRKPAEMATRSKSGKIAGSAREPPQPPAREKTAYRKSDAQSAKSVKKKRVEEQKPEEEKPPAGMIDLGGVPESRAPADKPVPCYQPDKCHIAPPTMASPAPIITSSLTTPSASTNVAFSTTTTTTTTKGPQSIATTAPTTVTSCNLSSVSTTVVLTENLARKEIGERAKPEVAESENGAKLIRVKPNGSLVESVGFRETEKAGEIASAKKVIKAEPDMEVLSPNNLRNSPPRMPLPPANAAWNEEGLANGDVPARVPKETCCRRFLTALWNFFRCLLCCGCFRSCCGRESRSNCCRGNRRCCGGGGNPFKCLRCKCKKPKCCEGSRCCGSKSKSKEASGSCCAKPICGCGNCRERLRLCCLGCGECVNGFCRSLFCLNTICCQNILKKCKCCHRLKCCQANGCCSCCNPYVRVEKKKLMKKASHASSSSRVHDQVDPVLVEHNSRMKAAIPVLPTCLSVFCLICNILVPGLGTILSGIFCLCFGKPRFSTRDSPINRFKSFVVNTIIGVAQAFTVVFCLVGWGWSVWWGVIMYKLSRRQKRLDLAEKSQRELESSKASQSQGDVEQG